MFLDELKKRKLTLIVAPVDGRWGFRKIAIECRDLLNIDLSRNEDVVVVISKSSKVAKVVFQDVFARYTLICCLHSGSYQRLMTDVMGPALKKITYDQLINYLKGIPIECKREDLFSH